MVPNKYVQARPARLLYFIFMDFFSKEIYHMRCDFFYVVPKKSYEKPPRLGFFTNNFLDAVMLSQISRIPDLGPALFTSPTTLQYRIVVRYGINVQGGRSLQF